MRLLAILLQLLFMIPLTAQITINGIMDETQYQCLGFFTSGRNGFGTGNDIGCIKYYSNNTTLYIG
ncbi:MAG: hypothetical protein N2747_11525, partial [Chitinophagaceae bacterium]|nr:hypothetical protein [Chitinophagaceae bacterium]